MNFITKMCGHAEYRQTESTDASGMTKKKKESEENRELGKKSG